MKNYCFINTVTNKLTKKMSKSPKTPSKTSKQSTSNQSPYPGNPHSTKSQGKNQNNTSSSTISQSEITSILSACTYNFRFDGRSNLHIRPYTLLKSTSTNSASNEINKEITPILSNGSSRLLLPGSNTDIICSIKADIVRPPQYQSKSQGLIELNVDILPFASASSTMDRRTVRKEEMEITSTLMHLLIPHLVDKEQLVILKGRYVWRLYIDIMVMHCDGNLMDACSMAIWGAMQNVKLPLVVPVVPFDEDDEGKEGSQTSSVKKGKKALDELMLDGDIANAIVPTGVLSCPIVVTICLLPKTSITSECTASERSVSKGSDFVMVVDTTKQEEACASTKVSVSVDPHGNICGIHKYGNSSVLLGNGGVNGSKGTISFAAISQIQKTAISVSKSVFTLLMTDSSDTQPIGTSTNNFFRGHFELQ